MQTPSGHCRAHAKRHQTPSRHEPKTAQTASQKTVSRYLWNPHKTIFGVTEHMPSLCKHHLDTADAKRPKHHAQTLCRNTIWTLQMQKDCFKRYHLDIEPKTAQTASQKTVSRYLWNPHKTTLEPQFTCPAYANTIWTLQMQKDPNTI